jgi:hypothetical protein
MPRNTTSDSVDVEVITDEVTPETSAEKPAKAKKEPARGDLPEGYVTPVGLAHELGRRGLQRNKEGEVLETVPPQMVYSYMNNASENDPFPIETVTDSIGKERSALQLEEGIAWWERKNERAAARRANALEKAQKKAAAAANKPESTDEAEAAEEVE